MIEAHVMPPALSPATLFNLFMSIEKPNIYLFLSDGCELYTAMEGQSTDSWNRDLLSKLIDKCARISLGEIWIRIPGTVLGEKSFIDYLYLLSRFREIKLIDSITIQCNAESMKLRSTERIYEKFKLSLVVCDCPNCGVSRPKEIVSNYLLAESIFKSVSLVGPSPAECVFGINAGTNIRHKCLFEKNLVFIMNNYTAQKCPIGHLPVIGNIRHESIERILERSCADTAETPPVPLEIADNININICQICKKKLRRGV